MNNAAVTDIDSYLANQPENVRDALEKLRQTIKQLVPDAIEVISYQMPAFKYHGILVYFAAFKNHCSLFPGNAKIISQFKDELKEFVTSKGTIQFTLEKPIPDDLLKKIIIARMNENLSKCKK
jgi:uncharacterized protein YdhG (YjbR/CyaY superfamily)